MLRLIAMCSCRSAYTFVWFVLITASSAERKSVEEGDTARLRCHQKVSEPVDWRYQIHPSAQNVSLCVGGRLVEQHKARFELDAEDYTLVIRDVRVNDSGRYTCIEKSGTGRIHIHHLVVGANKPVSNRALVNDDVRPGEDVGVGIAGVVVVDVVVLLLAIVVICGCLFVKHLCSRQTATVCTTSEQMNEKISMIT